MKFQVTAITAFTALLATTTLAFAPRTISHVSTVAPTTKHLSSATLLQMTVENEEVARLLAAAAKAREEAARLSKELGKEEQVTTIYNTATVAKKKNKSPQEIADAFDSIDFAAPAQAQIAALDKLREEGCLSLYKSATAQGGSGDLRAYPVSLNMLESRSGLTAQKLGIGVEEVSLDDFKYATLYVTGGCSVAGIAALAFLPENIGATVCYLVAVIPILFLGIGSTAPAAIANVIASVKGTEDAVDKTDRVCRHEAAHFLCGYLCGLPIAEYATTEENIPRVEFHSTVEGPLTAKRELTEDEVNALTVVAMSGSVAEAMSFGTAGGANSDLIELQGIFRRSKNFLGAEKQQDLTRWGALTAYRLLTMHKEKLEMLVEAFAARKSVAECMAMLEQ